jgi:hypothetical protein
MNIDWDREAWFRLVSERKESAVVLAVSNMNGQVLVMTSPSARRWSKDAPLSGTAVKVDLPDGGVFWARPATCVHEAAGCFEVPVVHAAISEGSDPEQCCMDVGFDAMPDVFGRSCSEAVQFRTQFCGIIGTQPVAVQLFALAEGTDFIICRDASRHCDRKWAAVTHLMECALDGGRVDGDSVPSFDFGSSPKWATFEETVWKSETMEVLGRSAFEMLSMVHGFSSQEAEFVFPALKPHGTGLTGWSEFDEDIFARVKGELSSTEREQLESSALVLTKHVFHEGSYCSVCIRGTDYLPSGSAEELYVLMRAQQTPMHRWTFETTTHPKLTSSRNVLNLAPRGVFMRVPLRTKRKLSAASRPAGASAASGASDASGASAGGSPGGLRWLRRVSAPASSLNCLLPYEKAE